MDSNACIWKDFLAFDFIHLFLNPSHFITIILRWLNIMHYNCFCYILSREIFNFFIS
ncbi:MAG: hypothetical protein ACKPKO_33750 [Candidatus Fonsibacter sp.]